MNNVTFYVLLPKYASLWCTNVTGVDQVQGGQALEPSQAREECCLATGVGRRWQHLHHHVILKNIFEQ